MDIRNYLCDFLETWLQKGLAQVEVPWQTRSMDTPYVLVSCEKLKIKDGKDESGFLWGDKAKVFRIQFKMENTLVKFNQRAKTEKEAIEVSTEKLRERFASLFERKQAFMKRNGKSPHFATKRDPNAVGPM